MSTSEMVDAALAGLDLGEFATAPSLVDAGQWESFDQSRRALAPQLSRSVPAARFGVTPTVK